MRDCITEFEARAACQYGAAASICRSFEAFSGDAAVLAGAGRSYEEIAAGREAAAA